VSNERSAVKNRRGGRFSSRWRACFACASVLVLADVEAGELADAVRQGNTASVSVLLKSAANGELNSPSRDGMTPLLWAAQANDVEVSRLLLESGADANLGNRYGITPLWLAATNRSPSLMTALLEHGADASAALPHGETPLMAAARSGDAESIRLLLEAGADPNAKEASLGETALMWAAAEDHAEAIRVLVAGGANPNLASSALDLAPMNWLQIGMVSTVLPVGGWPPLLFAARENARAGALALIEAGADPDIRDPDGLTAMNVAVMNQHYDLAVALLEAGADPDVADRTGMTALYGAVEMATVGVVFGRPPVPRNDQHSATDFMRLALEHGADPNARLTGPILAQHHGFPDRALAAGATPLMRAAKGHDAETLRLLLEAGASAQAQQDDGSGVLHVMATARARRSDEELAVAREVLKLLLEAGAPLEAVAADGQTAMHRAARSGNSSFVEILFENGARLDVADKEGRTPLDIVTAEGRSNNPDIAALLKRLASG
jgi:ankyrin repeat protein